eukprot:1634614-Rhodomonas_salina.2
MTYSNCMFLRKLHVPPQALLSAYVSPAIYLCKPCYLPTRCAVLRARMLPGHTRQRQWKWEHGTGGEGERERERGGAGRGGCKGLRGCSRGPIR